MQDIAILRLGDAGAPTPGAPKAGPFFIIGGMLLFHAAPLSECERRADRLDNPYSHEALFERALGRHLDYIDFPRGRVVRDLTGDRAIVYIDPCINDPASLSAVAAAFSLTDYRVEGDVHYHCRKCSDSVWED